MVSFRKATVTDDHWSGRPDSKKVVPRFLEFFLGDSPVNSVEARLRTRNPPLEKTLQSFGSIENRGLGGGFNHFFLKEYSSLGNLTTAHIFQIGGKKQTTNEFFFEKKKSIFLKRRGVLEAH